jgi:hypothetical protein
MPKSMTPDTPISAPMIKGCCAMAAHEHQAIPSFISWGSLKKQSLEIAAIPGATLILFLSSLAVVCFLSGCGQEAPAPKPGSAADTPAEPPKPAAPTVPEDIQAAAQSLLGAETQVLLFGDLAKTGKQQFLAANVVPKTPKNNNIAGTIITRAVIGENQDGKWSEIFRCDEHLKNTRGFLGLTPLSPVTGWRIQYEQNPVRGLQLYFTSVQSAADPHVLPIGVRWNPQTKRYQSLDHSYEHFLVESPNLGGTPRSTLR